MDKRLRELLDLLGVPEMRKDISKPSNLRWLSRNIQIGRSGELLNEARRLVVEKLRRTK